VLREQTECQEYYCPARTETIEPAGSKEKDRYRLTATGDMDGIVSAARVMPLTLEQAQHNPAVKINQIMNYRGIRAYG